jgi:hypothetical protein
MNTTTIRKFKLHFVWQEDKEEQWLHDMARQGWHLQTANMLCIYTFVQGQPADVTYRLDYRPGVQDPHYVQLFEDAGWERVLHVMGWEYWRKSQVQGQEAEIFTDAASKARQLWRLMSVSVAVLIPATIMLATNLRHMSSEALSGGTFELGVLIGASIAGIVLPLYVLARILMRIHKLGRG